MPSQRTLRRLSSINDTSTQRTILLSPFFPPARARVVVVVLLLLFPTHLEFKSVLPPDDFGDVSARAGAHPTLMTEDGNTKNKMIPPCSAAIVRRYLIRHTH